MSERRFPYEITTRWRVPGEVEAVYAVLTDAPALPRWWPDAYRQVEEIAPGDADGRGRVSRIVTRGALPYDVEWKLTVVDAEPPLAIRVEASGDLTGEGQWTLRQEGIDVVLTYLWRVRVEKIWMQRFEFILKPLFILNHNYVMRRGEAGLRRELARRASGGSGP